MANGIANSLVVDVNDIVVDIGLETRDELGNQDGVAFISRHNFLLSHYLLLLVCAFVLH